jgi:hypothetical protein
MSKNIGLCALINNNTKLVVTARIKQFVLNYDDQDMAADHFCALVGMTPKENEESITKVKNVLDNMSMRLAKQEKREKALAAAPKKIIAPALKSMSLADKKALLGKLALQERKLITEAELEAKRMEQEKKDNAALALKQETSRKALDAYKAKLLNKTASIVVKPDSRPVNIESMTKAMNGFYAHQDALKAKMVKEEKQNKDLDKAIMEKLAKLNG